MSVQATSARSEATEAGGAARRSGWAVAVAATLGMSVSYIDRQTLAAIAPAVRAALALDHTQFGWLLSAFSMAYLVGAPTAGIVVDRLGARRGFAVAVVLWSLVAGAHALASSFAALILLRLLLGAAEAPSFPAATQAIRRALPPARRPAAYGLLFTGSSLGAMIAAPLALGLESRYGFRYAFVGTAVTGALWIPLWLAMTRGDRVPAEVSGTTEAAGGGASTPRGRAPEPPPREAPAPLPRDGWLGVVSSPPVLRAVVAIFGSAPALMFVLSWSSQYLVEEWHLARTDIGGYLVLPPLLFDVGAVGFGLLASARKSARAADDAPSTPRALLVAATALTSLLALAPLAPSPGAAMALFAAAACGGGGVYVLVTADTLARVPLDRTSSAGGMTAAAQSLAHIIAGPLVGGAVDRTHSYASALVVLGLAAVPTSLAFVLWPSMRKR